MTTRLSALGLAIAAVLCTAAAIPAQAHHLDRFCARPHRHSMDYACHHQHEYEARGHHHVAHIRGAHRTLASWYGWSWHGRTMANGHRFHALGTSVASNNYPLGTKLRVVSAETGRSVTVSVDDRMGHPGRIDLSLGAARVLGMEHEGVAPVLLQVVSRHPLRRHHHAHTRRT